MDREEIMTYLPHREPMLLVDKSFLSDGEVFSEYTIRGDEFFLKGHFPGNPLVPGVILCEIMAQASFLLFKDHLIDNMALYAGMDNVRFKHQVRPGETVAVRARISARRGNYLVVEAEAKADGIRCSQGTLSFMLVKKETK